MTRKRTHARRKPRKTRINAKVRKLLQHLVLDGWTLEKSAEAVGWTLDWAHRLLKRPDVLALRKELLAGVLSASASRAARKVDDLMDEAASSAVQLDAAQFMLGCEGIGPIDRSEHLHHHSGSVVPGLTVVFAEWRPHDVEGVEVSAHAPVITRIGSPTPHPIDVGSERRRLLQSLPARTPHPTERGSQDD